MNEVFGEFPFSIQPYAKTSYPRVDVIEYPDKLVLEAEIAGLNKEDVSVDLEGDTLVIRGGKKQQAESDTSKGRYLFKEIKRSSFSRSFVLGDGIDKTAIKADFKDGTLKVELPRLKPEDKKTRHVKLL
jgi:HSP20 family protein